MATAINNNTPIDKIMNVKPKLTKTEEVKKLKAELKIFKDNNNLLNNKSNLGWHKYFELKDAVDENYVREQNRLFRVEKGDNKKFFELREKMAGTIEEISDDIKEVHYKLLLDSLMELGNVI